VRCVDGVRYCSRGALECQCARPESQKGYGSVKWLARVEGPQNVDELLANVVGECAIPPAEAARDEKQPIEPNFGTADGAG